MKVTSHGAARQVTGSKHLVELDGKKILLDCGMFQGRRDDSNRKNREFGFDPKDLEAVVLSHAHIDHCGLLPLLVKKGFKGTIYTTPATRDLCSIMLQDCAHIQQRDAEFLSKKKQGCVPPLYDDNDVQQAMKRFVSVPYEVPVPLLPNMKLTLRNAGHVLGSAMIDLEYEEGGQSRSFIFTGDIGRKNMPILEDPWEPTEADTVMMESTYGNRDHDPIEQVDEKLAAIIQETVDRGGKIIIPTFALERAQEVIFSLKRLEMKNLIPDIPVFVDSPMTVNITEVFRLHTESFDEQFREVMQEAGNPFELKNIRYVRDRQQSMEINKRKGPAIILSASGMCEFGRIVHHLRNNCEDKNSTILIVGYQAQHTLGRRIVERARQIKIFGVKHDLNAQVKVMNEFSAHAGQRSLLAFARRFRNYGSNIVLVHGEDEALKVLKGELDQDGFPSVSIQEEGVPIEV